MAEAVKKWGEHSSCWHRTLDKSAFKEENPVSHSSAACVRIKGGRGIFRPPRTTAILFNSSSLTQLQWEKIKLDVFGFTPLQVFWKSLPSLSRCLENKFSQDWSKTQVCSTHLQLPKNQLRPLLEIRLNWKDGNWIPTLVENHWSVQGLPQSGTPCNYQPTKDTVFRTGAYLIGFGFFKSPSAFLISLPYLLDLPPASQLPSISSTNH